jgi:hypothetical protein
MYISVFLSAAIVEGLETHENINRSIRHPQHTQISSNPSTIAGNNNTDMYIIHYSIKAYCIFRRNTLSTTIVILI